MPINIADQRPLLLLNFTKHLPDNFFKKIRLFSILRFTIQLQI